MVRPLQTGRDPRAGQRHGMDSPGTWQLRCSTMLVPAVLVVMNVLYALSAYPAGVLADNGGRYRILVFGIILLGAADLVLAFVPGIVGVAIRVAAWGLHMGFTRGLLATLVAHNSPPELRGTAFGMFNLVTGAALRASGCSVGPHRRAGNLSGGRRSCLPFSLGSARHSWSHRSRRRRMNSYLIVFFGPQPWRLFLPTGLLGGFTTFSAFSLDVALMYERDQYALLVLYAGGSVLISIAALALGLWVVRTHVA